MNLGLKEKVVLVTGASKGIGKAIAAAFAAEGSSVVLNARNQQELEQAAQEIQQHGGQALALAADVTNASEVQRLAQQAVARFGTIHVLVNNVGGADGFASFEELSDEDWINVFQVSDRVPWNGTGLCLGSTAIRRSVAAAPLWPSRSTHQGILTRCPCSSSLAGRATFSG